MIKLVTLLPTYFTDEKINQITGRARGDLLRVSTVARTMVEKFGMSDKIGVHAEPTQNLMGENLRNQIDEEILSIIKESEKRATKILGNHKKHLEKLSEELNTKELLCSCKVKKIITDVNIKMPDHLPNCDYCKAFQTNIEKCTVDCWT